MAEYPLFEKSVVKTASDKVFCRVEEEAVILDLGGSRYYGLDPIGARIWELMQSPIRVDQLVNQLLEEYEVDAEVCRRDVLALLGALMENGLIEIGNGVVE